MEMCFNYQDVGRSCSLLNNSDGQLRIFGICSADLPSFTAWNTKPRETQFCSESRKIANISQRVYSVNMDQIELALEALRSAKPGEKPNISLVARTYGVDRSSLSRHFRGVSGSKEAQYNSQRLLSKQQSRALIKWINELTERGLPPTNQMLVNFTVRYPVKSSERIGLHAGLRLIRIR